MIGSYGGSAPAGGSIGISFTAGEAVVNTLNAAPYALTQGFHQPKSGDPLRFDLELGFASCPSSSDGVASVVNIRGCAPPYLVSWSNGISGTENDRLTPGPHSVTVTAGPCMLTQEFEMEFDPEGNCILRFFNAFSPNGDGVNDRWEIENIDLSEFHDNEVEIFNRWGQSVWKGRNYDNESVVWDGSGPSGKVLPQGTYFYLANVAGRVHKGYIELTK